MKEIDPKALFRLSVLGPLVSRERLERGELQHIIGELAQRQYQIPGSRRTYLSEKTIEAWLGKYRRDGIAGLTPKVRVDRGQSKIAQPIQEAILAAKRDNPKRSIRQIKQLLQSSGQAARDSLSCSAIHRLLQQHGISRMNGSVSRPEEKRSFVAESGRCHLVWRCDARAARHRRRTIAQGLSGLTHGRRLAPDHAQCILSWRDST